MGQKIHPNGFRLGVIRGHESHWIYPKKQYREALHSDSVLRKSLHEKIGKGLISRIEIERAANRVKVTVYTSRPGAVIGRGGKGIDQLTADLNKMVRKDDPTAQVQVNVAEVRQPELDAQLIADNIAQQLEKRVSHRRAMRQCMTRAKRMNARGMKIIVSGRLNGAEIARSEADMFGKIPLHTLRADIDYGVGTAFTIYGSVGVKVWVYRGEVLPEKQLAAMQMEANERPRRERKEGDRPNRGDRPERQDRGDRPSYRDRNAQPANAEGGAPAAEGQQQGQGYQGGGYQGGQGGGGYQGGQRQGGGYQGGGQRQGGGGYQGGGGGQRQGGGGGGRPSYGQGGQRSGYNDAPRPAYEGPRRRPVPEAPKADAPVVDTPKSNPEVTE